MSQIFKDFAPAYWEAGLPVIPLAPKGKNPIPVKWTEFAHHMPEPALQQSWMASTPDSNIGVVLGPESGLLVLDIDTPDERVITELRKRLPESPWHRVGAKGAVWAYKFNGLKSFRIRAEGHGTMVELLSERLQVVLPPSIHPNTLKPYTENVPLLSVLSVIPELPSDVESIIRDVLEDLGYDLNSGGISAMTNFVSIGARDTQMISHAGLLATDVLRGTTALLEALERMAFWCNTYTEHVDGDPLDAAKGQEKVIQFLIKDVLHKGHGRTLPDGWDFELTDEQKKNWGLEIFTAEHEQWTFERIKTYLMSKFNTSGGRENPQTVVAIEYALARLSESTCISDMDEDRLLRWIQETSGLALSLAGLRKQIRSQREGEIKGIDHTELAEAVFADMEERGSLRHHNGSFWQWQGSHWSKLEDAIVLRTIAKGYGTYAAARKAGDHKGIMNVLASICRKSIDIGKIKGINFANGFLTEDLKLHTHQSDFGCTYTLPYRYIPEDTRCPKFLEFLGACWSEDDDYEEKVQAMRAAICSTLFQKGSEFQKAVLLLGVPHSGKTQLLNIVQGLIPEEGSASVPPTEWADKFMPAQLYGKMANFAGELSEERNIRADIFKLIVEGTKISAQYKGQQIFEFHPTCTHWFGSNHEPRTKDTSNGFNRRWLMFSFNKSVSLKDTVTNLAQKILSEEREAIVSWAVQIIHELKENQALFLPPSHHALVKKMANNNNSVRHFLNSSSNVTFSELDVRVAGGRVLPNITEQIVLFNEYHAFCVGLMGINPYNLQRFTAIMSDLAPEMGYKVETMVGKGVQGLSVLLGYRGLVLLA